MDKDLWGAMQDLSVPVIRMVQEAASIWSQPEFIIMLLIIFYTGIFGLIIGSFLNVCIYRIPAGRNVAKGHSMCMDCGHNLGVLDLVPVFSWLFLRGKCRYCVSPIASRYAKIEGLTGLVFISIALLRSDWIFMPWYEFSTAHVVNMIKFLLLLVLGAVVIVTTMVQFDHGKGLKGAVLTVIGIGVLRFALLFFEQALAEKVLISSAMGVSMSGLAVLISVFFTGDTVAESAKAHRLSALRLRGFQSYFLPQRYAVRLSDALVLALGFVLGFPVALPIAVGYVLVRAIFIIDKSIRYIGLFTAAVAWLAFAVLSRSVF